MYCEIKMLSKRLRNETLADARARRQGDKLGPRAHPVLEPLQITMQKRAMARSGVVEKMDLREERETQETEKRTK